MTKQRAGTLTSIRVDFYGIAKGKRQAHFHSVEIDNQEGKLHLTPLQIGIYKVKALEIIEKQGYRLSMDKLHLCTYMERWHDFDENTGFYITDMNPEQKSPFTRTIDNTQTPS